MFDIYEVLDQPIPPGLTIVDVGAASMGKGTDPYHALSDLPHVNIIGFEPNQAACAQRNAEAKANQRYLPYFVADGTRRRFHLCKNPLTSSLYEPDQALLGKFQNMDLPVAEIHEVDTVRLDDIPEIGDCDFLKLDIQGAELDAINGAPKLLQNALVVHTEIEFIPMYKHQPLFGDVDVKLREQGFLIHKFEGIFGRVMRPLAVNNQTNIPLNQILFAEAAVYVRSFMEFDKLPVAKLINLACILHTVYSSYDMCALALESADKQAGTGLRERYIQRLTQTPQA